MIRIPQWTIWYIVAPNDQPAVRGIILVMSSALMKPNIIKRSPCVLLNENIRLLPVPGSRAFQTNVEALVSHAAINTWRHLRVLFQVDQTPRSRFQDPKTWRLRVPEKDYQVSNFIGETIINIMNHMELSYFFGATPSSHPFIDVPLAKPSSYWGSPMTMETPSHLHQGSPHIFCRRKSPDFFFGYDVLNHSSHKKRSNLIFGFQLYDFWKWNVVELVSKVGKMVSTLKCWFQTVSSPF